MNRLLLNIIYCAIMLNLIFSFRTAYAYQQNAGWSEPVNITEINSPADDYGFIYNRFDDKYYFTSEKSGYAYFYNTTMTEDSIGEAQLIKNGINQPSNNQAYFCPVSQDEAYITTFRMSNRRPYQNIFKTVYQKQVWTSPYIPEEFQMDAYMGMSTVSADGNTMIFISNYGNDNGDTDIWSASKSITGQWGAYSRIDRLNSIGNEITPYLISDDTLFFASDGYGGPGGFDIYYSVKQLGEWQRPRPFNVINTEFNESDPTVLPDGSIVFASDRPGGEGGYDLYRIKRTALKETETGIDEYKLSVLAQVPLIRFSRIKSDMIFPFIMKLNPRLKNIDKLMIDTLANRMKIYQNATVAISSINQSKEIADRLISAGIEESRIVLNDPGISFQNKIDINSDEIELFKPVKISNYSYSFEPQVIEINLDARPREAIGEWELEVSSELGDSTLMSGNRLPATLYYRLNDKLNNYISPDSLTVIFSDLDDSTKNTSLALPFRVSDVNAHNIVKYDNFLFFEYYLFINSRNDIETIAFGQLKPLLNRHNTDRILLFYEDDIFLKDVKKYLSDIFDNVRIESIKSEFDDSIDSDYRFKVLLKKAE